jgi:hypothetical protein
VDTGSSEEFKTRLVNFLPVLLYQIVNSPLCFNQVEFLNWNLLDSEVKRLVQTLYGSNTASTTKDKLKQRLLSLQDDVGFYKLNKQGNDYFAHPLHKNTMVVFNISTKQREDQQLSVSDIETWMTGYIIRNANQLHFNIVKQAPDIEKYPWIFTGRDTTMFNAGNHLKIELICRRKAKPDKLGLGFTLMSYFLSHYAYNFDNINMVLMDVARTHGEQGLPDPMFSQLLHERFKFQRTFEFQPLLQSTFVLNLPADVRESTTQALNNTFSTQEHAPYLKVFVNLDANTIQQEFTGLQPDDVDLNALRDPDVQNTLQSAVKTLTFTRPMPTLEDMATIYQRFYQSVVEKKKNVATGQLIGY